MKNKKFLLVAVAGLFLFGAGFLLGRSKVAPGSTEVVEKEVIKRDVRTIVKEVVRPDGSKEIVTEIVDRTKEATDKKAVQGPPRVAVTVSATASVDYKNLQPVYGILLQKPILFDRIQAGLGFDTKGQVLATIGYSF